MKTVFFFFLDLQNYFVCCMMIYPNIRFVPGIRIDAPGVGVD
jgi:hypothetical protein